MSSDSLCQTVSSNQVSIALGTMDTPNYQPEEIDHPITKPIGQIEDDFERNPIDEPDAIDEIEDLFLAACSQEGLYFDEVDEDICEGDESTFRNEFGWIRSQGQPFALILHDLLEHLLVWGESCVVGRNMGGLLALISEVGSNVQRVVDAYLQAIPKAVQTLFEMSIGRWTILCLLQMPTRSEVGMSIYIYFEVNTEGNSEQ